MVKFDKISICISTRNRKNILKETLDNIFHHQNLPYDKFEVIVTNDGDENLDDLKQIFPYENFRIVFNKHKQGLAGGRNNGVENSKYNLIIFFDDDILAIDNFFEKVIQIHNEEDPIILGGNRLYPDNLIKKASLYPFGRYKLLYEYKWLDENQLKLYRDSLYEVDSIAGFSMSLSKETYYKLGGFNEEFPFAGCEDAEFCYRAKKLGIRMLFDKSLICYHNELDNFELKNWLNRQATGIMSAVVMCKLHPEGKQHPTWYLNAPISRKDSFKVIIHKIFKKIISFTPIYKLIYVATKLFEKLKVPDVIIFKLYNILWMAVTFNSFRRAYKKYFNT